MRQLRAVHGLSQEALAHESCVDRTYVSSIERAQRSVSIDMSPGLQRRSRSSRGRC
jgi:transcriptional regulator with XRE-family HTH domain